MSCLPCEHNDDIRDFITESDKEFEQGKTISYVAVTKDSKVVVGQLQLFHIVQSGLRAEINYTFNPCHWGKGYATTAIGALMEFGFTTCKLRRIAAMVHINNAKSINALKRNEMVEEGRMSNYSIVNYNRWDDSKNPQSSDFFLYAKTRP